MFFDRVIWDNAPQADRRYRALVTTFEYRPARRWNVGGNLTFSRLEGNYEVQNFNSLFGGTPIGDYERSRPDAEAVPYGYLDGDVRHRLQVWGNYRFDLKGAGLLVLGGAGRYQSGQNWSRTASVPLAEDPVYNNEVGNVYTHYFDGRGHNNFDDWWTLDLSARWQFPLSSGRLDGWLKMTVMNVLDNDSVIAYQTTGTAVADAAGNLTWEPAGNCGPGDAPSTECTAFGRIRGPQDYQPPRSFLFTLGLQF